MTFSETQPAKKDIPKGYVVQGFAYPLGSEARMREAWAVDCARNRYQPVLIEKIGPKDNRIEGGPIAFDKASLQLAVDGEISGQVVALACGRDAS